MASRTGPGWSGPTAQLDPRQPTARAPSVKWPAAAWRSTDDPFLELHRRKSAAATSSGDGPGSVGAAARPRPGDPRVQPPDRAELRRVPRRRAVPGTHALRSPVQDDRLHHRPARRADFGDGARQPFQGGRHLQERRPDSGIPEAGPGDHRHRQPAARRQGHRQPRRLRADHLRPLRNPVAGRQLSRPQQRRQHRYPLRGPLRQRRPRPDRRPQCQQQPVSVRPVEHCGSVDAVRAGARPDGAAASSTATHRTPAMAPAATLPGSPPMSSGTSRSTSSSAATARRRAWPRS